MSGAHMSWHITCLSSELDTIPKPRKRHESIQILHRGSPLRRCCPSRCAMAQSPSPKPSEAQQKGPSSNHSTPTATGRISKAEAAADAERDLAVLALRPERRRLTSREPKSSSANEHLQATPISSSSARDPRGHWDTAGQRYVAQSLEGLTYSLTPVQPRGPHLSDPDFDYVIIGAGTAGCLLANRLSADPSRRVLLVEAGALTTIAWIHIPVGYLRCIGNPRTDWRYRTEPEAGPQRPRPAVSARQDAGRQLQHQRHDLHARPGARLRRAGPRPRATTRGAGRTCCRISARTNAVIAATSGARQHMHGARGEWRVSKQRLRWDILDAFAEAAEQAGFARIDGLQHAATTPASAIST